MLSGSLQAGRSVPVFAPHCNFLEKFDIKQSTTPVGKNLMLHIGKKGNDFVFSLYYPAWIFHHPLPDITVVIRAWYHDERSYSDQQRAYRRVQRGHSWVVEKLLWGLLVFATVSFLIINACTQRGLWFIFKLRMKKKGSVSCTNKHTCYIMRLFLHWSVTRNLYIIERLRRRWNCSKWVHPCFCPKADWFTFGSATWL